MNHKLWKNNNSNDILFFSFDVNVGVHNINLQFVLLYEAKNYIKCK